MWVCGRTLLQAAAAHKPYRRARACYNKPGWYRKCGPCLKALSGTFLNLFFVCCRTASFSLSYALFCTLVKIESAIFFFQLMENYGKSLSRATSVLFTVQILLLFVSCVGGRGRLPIRREDYRKMKNERRSSVSRRAFYMDSAYARCDH